MKVFLTNLTKDWTQILVILSVALLSLNMGIFLGWPSPAIPELLEEDHPVHMTFDEASYLTFIPSIFIFLGAIPISMLADWLGRKFTIVCATVPYIIAWLLIATSNSKWMFYASRMISGIGDSVPMMLTIVYIGEVASPKVRGRWGNLLVLSMFLGIVLANAIGGSFDIPTTAYIFLPLPIVNLVIMLFMAESPYYLIMKNRNEEAKRALRWLRQTDNIEEEFQAIADGVRQQMEESATYADLFRVESNRRAFFAAITARIVQQVSGKTVFIVYSQTIFTMAGGNLSASVSAVICSCAQLLFSFLSSMVVDKFGRRKMLFSSAACTIIALFIQATYFFLLEKTNVDLSNITWFPVVGMMIYLTVASMGLTIVPTLICGELFSASVKGKSIAAVNMVFAAMIVIVTKSFQLLSEYGLCAPFFCFGIFTTIFAVICYYVLPETKGKTLNEIQLLLKGKT